MGVGVSYTGKLRCKPNGQAEYIAGEIKNNIIEWYVKPDKKDDNMTLINEQNYIKTMTEEVEPFLRSKRNDGGFLSFDGNRIRFEEYRHECHRRC